MRYDEALEFIHSIARFGSKPGLRRIGMLLERMGNPQNRLRFVHVAGTNGKGSTCTMLSYILKQAGLKTGLYISPFVLDFNERIQINNEMISNDELAKSASLVHRHWQALDKAGEPPTEFEVVTAIAMDYFLRMRCDIVVLEVGLGGRFDATNIINTPLCSVITNISIDHTEYLGDTVAEIAFEKCGIIKPHGITVSYPHEPPEAAAVIAKTCAERDNRLITGGDAEILSMDIFGSVIRYGGMEIRVPLSGGHQVLNAVTAVEAARVLRLSGLSISDGDIVSGIRDTRFVSRLEILNEEPLVLLDGAHNLSGAAALAESLKLLQGRKIHALAGMMADKDADGILAEVLAFCESVTIFTPANPRAMKSGDLAKLARRYCPSVFIADTPDSAVSLPFSMLKGDDAMLIFGSLYLAAEIRPAAKRLLEELR